MDDQYEQIRTRYQVAVRSWTPTYESRIRQYGPNASREILDSWKDIPRLMEIIHDLEDQLKSKA